MPEEDLVGQLIDGARAIGSVRDEDAFRALIDAFRAADHDTYQRLIEKLQLVDRKRVVCEWIRSKESVLLCLELAGPPIKVDLPDPRELATAVVRISQDTDLVAKLADSVEHRDADGFRALLGDLQLDHLRHGICHWVTVIHTRLRCRIVSSLERIQPIYLTDEIVASGASLARLLDDRDAFDEAAKASLAGDSESLRRVLLRLDGNVACSFICEWFCSWRCLRLCFILNRPFPIDAPDVSLREAYEFAQVTAKLASDRDLFVGIVDAVSREDAPAYAKYIERLDLSRFSLQLCHWICSWRCRLHCDLVCRPVLLPWFTHIGHFDIYADIDPATGLTNKGLAYPGLGHGGGPDFGFFGDLELRGFCPVASPIDGTGMKYRFLIAGANTPITGSAVSNADAGSRQIPWPQNVGGVAGAATVSTFQTISIEGSPVAAPVPPAAGDPWYGPSKHVIVPDAAGWIVVDPLSISGGFTTLVGMDSTKDAPGGNPSAGIVAGAPIPAANQPDGTDLGIIFEATRVAGSGPNADYSNALSKVHINNWSAIRELTIQQFLAGPLLGCTPITSDLDVNYTIDHELMAAWNLEITSASPSAPNGVAGGTAPRGASASMHFATGTWKMCSYLVTLTTRTARTTGLIDDTGGSSQLTFCIGRG